jgi:hypothetical protein
MMERLAKECPPKYGPSCEDTIQVCDSDHTNDGTAMYKIEFMQQLKMYRGDIDRFKINNTLS